ncbi:MAG: Crp/Fnr family transcriptional regulator [Miltoncostaeaceae bacterium]
MATLTPLPSIPSTGSSEVTRPALARLDLFDGIPRRDLDLLDARLPLVRWPREADAPASLTRGDQVYIVRQGRIALGDVTSEGQDVTTTIVEAGAVYSSLGLESAPPAVALEASAVTPLPVHAIEALITRYPRFGVNLAVALTGRLANLHQTVAIVSEMRVEDRLRRRLHQIAEQIGTAAPEGVRIGLDLTHAQWASLIGASREAVTTAFGKLRSAGEVVMEGRSITIPWDAMNSMQQLSSLVHTGAEDPLPHAGSDADAEDTRSSKKQAMWRMIGSWPREGHPRDAAIRAAGCPHHVGVARAAGCRLPRWRSSPSWW